MVADGDDIIEQDVLEIIDMFGAMAGNIHTCLSHDADSIGIKAVGFDPGRVGFDEVGLEGARPAFGHLAAAGIAGAQEQDFQFWFCLRHNCSGSMARTS
jgi:hypothetical protein